MIALRMGIMEFNANVTAKLNISYALSHLHALVYARLTNPEEYKTDE